MKECKSCATSKVVEDYYIKHKDTGYRDMVCKQCRREECKKYRTENPKPAKPKAPRMEGFRLLPEGMRKCADCEEVKEKKLFYVDSNRASGTSVYCKVCATKRQAKKMEVSGAEVIAYRRKWAEDNREHIREKNRRYCEANRTKRTLSEARRRARKNALPDTLTHAETNEILAHFNGKCALCDKPSEALDHFVPIKTGMGGTTKENIIPLCSAMNSSKSARNPFEWAETHLDASAKERFRQTTEYLSEINGLTVEQYREFVFSCFKTTKNIS